MCGNGDAGFEKLIFQQELNEVYLLLDFISGQPSRDLSAVEVSDPSDTDPNRKLAAAAVVQRVSGLRYPPSPTNPPGGTPDQKGKDAAFLLLLKDKLNSLSRPARGLTIAYTILFSESGKDKRTSRLNAAELAFPGLIVNARRFRLLKGALSWSGLFITVVSALLLWQVTYGAHLAAHYDEAKQKDNDSAAAIYNVIEKDQDLKSKTNYLDLSALCAIKDDQHDGKAPDPDDRNATIRQLCGEYAYRHAQFCVAIYDIGQYSRSAVFRAAKWLLPVHKIKPARSCGDGDADDAGRQEDAQSVAGVLSMMSNYLLPILFGLVGTMAALVRGIQDKVTDSVLLPRDQALSLIRLPLGMVAGVSVGLFLSPTSIAQNGSSIGAFTISASGIAFLAGYGAEAFFRALDVLISRVFNLDKDTKPAGG